MTPTFSIDELSVEFGLDSDVVNFLNNEKFNEEDPLIILEFKSGFANLVGDFEANKCTVYNALISSGAEQIKGNVFKFKDWETMYESRRAMQNATWWAFFSYCPHVPVAHVPTIHTTVISWFSEYKLTAQPYEFFEL